MKNTILILLASLVSLIVRSQETFSIVAVDSVTGEVGSAGASCVDLFRAGLPSGDFLGQLIPNVGAINTQAFYLAENQNNATERMNLGETPSQIIDWLIANDVESFPQIRQYGVAALVDGSPEAAAHTGSLTDNYKNHIVGSNYAIQGNILLGQEVLDSMESRFLSASGDLACKLMAALQGANIIGADRRCETRGTSSLFAYLKVAHPSDEVGSPSLKVSVRTASNSGIEPIDSLQKAFDLMHNCRALSLTETESRQDLYAIYPNPATDYITIQANSEGSHQVYLFDMLGRLLYQTTMNRTKKVKVSQYNRGHFYIKIKGEAGTVVKKLVIR